jgi:pimeloyl-ACP methyl ester carboxylesterase
MGAVPPEQKERSQLAKPDKSGKPIFDWSLTHTSILDTVKLVMPPTNTVPIIFVPGIMGSNLESADDNRDPVWRLDGGITILWHKFASDQPVNLAKQWAFEQAGERQKVLHPAKCKVDPRGAVPKSKVGTVSSKQEYTDRGWGEVSQTSYQKFLLWLEEKMNPHNSNPAYWDDYYYVAVSATPKPGEIRPELKLPPGITMSMRGLPRQTDSGAFTAPVVSDELLARAKHRFPVYACGYNWLDTNLNAADLLKARIKKVIAENNKGHFTCSQVILVTHSMGGLVARACSELKDMQSSIAGIVHGVMPATGAAVAYRRCKVGMGDETDFVPAQVIGYTGKEVTAVFAQAPGALQLLPSQDYPKGWLKLEPESMRVARAANADPSMLDEILVVGSMPGKNPSPYESIYLRKDRWWGLVREEWLSPKDGISFSWDKFEKCIGKAKEFHSNGELGISGKYHPNSYVYYGDDDGKQASFATIQWQIKPGLQPGGDAVAPTASDVIGYKPQQTRTDGSNAIYVGGETKFETFYYGPMGGASTNTYDTSFWEFHCLKQDGKGDGTVPTCSGAAPAKAMPSAIKQQFALTGFSHEASYQNAVAQVTTLHCITKIAAVAKLPK